MNEQPRVDSSHTHLVHNGKHELTIDEFYADSTGVHATVGWRNRFGVCSRVELAAGVDHRRYEASATRDAQPRIEGPAPRWGDGGASAQPVAAVHL